MMHFPAVSSEHTVAWPLSSPVRPMQPCLGCWASPSRLGRPSCSPATGSPLLFTLC